MTTKKGTAGRGRAKKLKLKRETIRDLNPKKAGKDVKGGWGPIYPTMACKTQGCPSTPYGLCGPSSPDCPLTWDCPIAR
jgi:hypothetical protein